MESLLKDNKTELESKINTLNEHLNSFINEIKILRNENKVFSNAINSCNVAVNKLQK
jgi:septal ring factor EnvC (AmiA/AmiB activator)